MHIIAQFIANFPAQLTEAVELAEQIKITAPKHDIRNIVVAGLGGSGIGGSIAHALISNEIGVPFEVVKGYDIPAYTNAHTLFIASSYSGSTEETLASVEKAAEKGAKIACVTTGGKLLKLAQEKGYNVALMPFTEPICPRANLGYSLIQLLGLLQSYGLVTTNFLAQAKTAIALLQTHNESIQTEAKQLAGALVGKLPILYADYNFGAVAVRFQQQINENAKQFAHVNVFPEMNHNELVGWVHPKNLLKDTVVVFFQSTFNNARNTIRMQVCEPIFGRATQNFYQLHAKGESALAHVLYFIYLTDWASYYLAEQNGADAYEIDVINHLKNELAKV